jgi:hypothetical protein
MVLDSATGAPIKNAVVRVLDVDRQSKQITLRSSRTDASGGATLVAVTAQTHEVVVMAPGYGRERRTIALTRGRPTYLPVQLWPGASVSGFVRDGRGQPVGGATVSIQYEPVARDRLSRLMDGTWQRGTFETAPDSGGFRVLDVNAYAHFKIVVSVSGLPHAEVGPFYLDPGQQLSDLVIQLQR